jgi:hypothetical protein
MEPLTLWAMGMSVYGMGVAIDPPKTPEQRRVASLLLAYVAGVGLLIIARVAFSK